MGPLDRVRRIALLAALGAALAVLSCRSGPEEKLPFRAPEVTSTAEHFLGSIVTGPRSGSIHEPPSAFHAVRVSFIALEEMPRDFGSPVVSRARLILSATGSRPALLPDARRSEGVRVGSGEASRRRLLREIEGDRWGEHETFAELRGVVAPGVTADFRVMGEDGRITIEVHRDAEDRGVVPKKLGVAFVSGGAEASLIEFEPEGDVHVITAVFPSPWPEDTGAAVVVTIDATLPPPTGTAERRAHNEAVLRCYEDIARIAKEPQRIEPIEVPVWSSVEPALLGLSDDATRRSALAYLAGLTGASLTEDLALAAPEDLLRAVISDLDVESLPREPDSLAFVLERASLLNLAEAMRGEDPPPQIDAFMARHTGQVGMHPELLDDVVKKSADLSELRRKLITENLFFLMDTAPEPRVRAFDWLALEGRAPEGYDPLADVEERRGAIESYKEKVLGERAEQ